MEIFEAKIEDKAKWDEFVSNNEMGSFLQAWAWGDFMSEYRKAKVWRLVVEENGEWLGVMMLYMGKLRLGMNYLSSPRGPVVKFKEQISRLSILELMMEKVNEIAKEENSLYVQIEPYSEDKTWVADMTEIGLVKTKDNVMPRYTLIMGISDDEESLLKAMHHKTRYNIRLAKKKGVEILVDNSRVDDFYQLLMETSRRQGVSFFGKSYFESLLQHPNVKLYIAKYDGVIVAANIILWWGDMATYLFGASGLKHRNVMAPHLLQWTAMNDAKEAGMTKYDFWGAVPDGVVGKEQKWAGVTRFKKGFCPGTEVTTYIGTYERVYRSRALNTYKIARRLLGS